MIALARLAPEGCDVPDMQVRGVALDSRRVTAGCLFLALQGETSDGHDFIDAAVANGAAAVFAQHPVADCAVPLVVVSNLAKQVSHIAGEFFGHPSHHIDCVAVTGTNGKTSVAHFAAELAAALGIRAGFLGTTGWGLIGKSALQPATLTTADAVLLQERLHQLRTDGVQLVALELSSHALQQHRGDALGIDVALFTNLSRDHLDYHGNMAGYGAAKARLFEFPSLRGMVLSADDAFGASVARTLARQADQLNDSPCTTRTPILSLVSDHSEHDSKPANTSSAQQSNRDNQQFVRISGLTSSSKGMCWNLSTPWGDAALSSEVIGRYNAVNISLAVAALALLGHDLRSIVDVVPELRAPAGRLQRVSDSPGVFVDYAHTPAALETVLQAARAHCAGKLICVFGCGGDRDAGKRAAMGRAVVQFADLGWLTSDNPRFEDPAVIIADVEAGLQQDADSRRKVHSVLDRRAAIAAAIAAAGPDDVVIIAGKGHEDYQDIKGVRHPFDDALVAQAILAGGAH